MNHPRLILFLLCIVPVLACANGAHADESLEYAKAKKLGKLDKKISESSGLAASLRNSHMLWTHNDSGHDTTLYAIDLDGDTVGTCQLKGVKNVDWEDMASFQMNGEPYLLIGDFGDNGHTRKEVQLHLVREPESKGSKKIDAKVKVDRTIKFKYQTGCQDCECVAVDPADHSIFLIVKGWTPMCEVFTFPMPDESDDSVQTAKRLATLKIAAATGMDISNDGRRAVVVTYGHAYEFHRNEDESWKDAFSREGQEIKLPKRKQGEAICYGSDGRTLFVTSEKAPSPLYRLLPKKSGDE